ncbi:hypothetical protein [Corynebacterium sp. LK19]|uniref:hypothetical protein n=1 Tax=Corynebacterium sp. LK19 TaxID=2022660 RepID=UPI0011CCA598|nr:hypothetical protein [Corynebacterium sp. LK19]
MDNTTPTNDDLHHCKQLIGRIASIDPRFPEPTDNRARGWCEVFAGRGYTWAELFRAVVDFYATNTRNALCMPALLLEQADITRKNAPLTPELEYRRAIAQWERDCKIAETEGERYPAKPTRGQFYGT